VGTGASGGAGGNGLTAAGTTYGGNGGGYPPWGQNYMSGPGPFDYGAQTWDTTYGTGGGAGGGGGITVSTGTCATGGGAGGLFGSGGGSCGYCPNTGVTWGPGSGWSGLIILHFPPAPPGLSAPAIAARSLQIKGPSYRFNAPMLASPLPAVTVTVTIQGGTLPIMGVG